ncbi:MAG TPA: GNAT family N-acetyltransferase [Acidimicrobiales bacterium]|nr:GNAT family N-acetyltransferase [Acidimicrobiales bacterium]
MVEAQPSDPPGYPKRWEADAVLSDGGTVHVRPIRPSDRRALSELHDRLSERTVYLRFFTPLPHLSDALLERFTVVDYVDRLALVAELGDRLVAVARYDRMAGSDEAEVAFVVDDAHQGRGMGTLLLEHLAAAAAEAGIRRFVAETLPGNQRMLGVFLDAGFGAVRRFDSGVVRVSFKIEPTDESVRAMQERERRASARSVARILCPRSVAVVGASRRPGSVGHAVLRYLLAGQFTGAVYAVNPEADEVAGIKAYRSVLELPEPVDVAVIVVPARAVEAVVQDCAAGSVGGLVILSGGFGETGPEGAAVERRIVLTARSHGMRVIGPNCMGVANTSPDVRMNASLSPVVPGPGPVGFMGQGGALGIAVLEEARRRGIGISTFVSAGNKADISGNDLLNYWEDDTDTRVILLYLESFGNPRTFSRVARRISRTKPIVAVKGGRTPAGSRAVTAHSGASASPEGPVDALFRQTGVIRVDSLDQLLDVAHALALQPLPAGGRVGIVANSGGPGVLAADACEGAGLIVPELAPPTSRRLAELGALALGNPVTLDTSAPAADYGAALEALLGDPGIDAALALYFPPVVSDAAAVEERASEVAAAIAAAAGRGDKPVLANFLAIGGAPAALRPAHGRGVPSYAFPEAAARALAHMASLSEWRRRPEGKVPQPADVDRAGALSTIAGVLERHPEGGWLGPAETAAVLASYGLSLGPAAGVHPEALGVAIDPDPSFGPVVSVHAPGMPAARAARVLPLTDVDAAELVRTPPLAAAVPDGAAEAMEEMLLRLTLLAEQVPELAEARAEVVPAPHPRLVGARLRVAPNESLPELAIRRLR